MIEIPGFDLDDFVQRVLAEDLGTGGDVTSKARVVRAIHLAHRAAAQKGDDFVSPEAVPRRQRHCCGKL